MGSVLKPLEKPFRTGASSQKRRAEEEARRQEQLMRQQQAEFERQRAEQERRLEEQRKEQEARRMQAENQAKLEQSLASEATDDSAEIVTGGDILGEGSSQRKRKRRALTGSSALGI